MHFQNRGVQSSRLSFSNRNFKLQRQRLIGRAAQKEQPSITMETEVAQGFILERICGIAVEYVNKKL